MRTFADLQRGFSRGLATGDVPGDVIALERDEIPRRFAVYRNNATVSLTEALRRRFPVIERLVGEDFAKAMFAAYTRQHPPRSPLMMQYGEAMPDFLQGFPPVARLPYLGDIARLELARGRAYHSADLEPLGRDALAAASTRDPAALRFDLHPSLCVLRSRYPVFTIWSMDQPGAQPVPIADWQGECVLVARSGLSMITTALTPAEAAFVARLVDSASVAVAAEAANAAFDPAPLLARLFGAGLVVAAR